MVIFRGEKMVVFLAWLGVVFVGWDGPKIFSFFCAIACAIGCFAQRGPRGGGCAKERC